MSKPRTARQLACATYTAPLAPGWGASLAQTHHYADARPVMPVALPPAGDALHWRVLAYFATITVLPDMPALARRLDTDCDRLRRALSWLRTEGKIVTATQPRGGNLPAEWRCVVMETGQVLESRGWRS